MKKNLPNYKIDVVLKKKPQLATTNTTGIIQATNKGWSRVYRRYDKHTGIEVIISMIGLLDFLKSEGYNQFGEKVEKPESIVVEEAPVIKEPEPVIKQVKKSTIPTRKTTTAPKKAPIKAKESK